MTPKAKAFWPMNTGVIDHATNPAPLRGRPSAAKSWLKAIELTSRIEAESHRLFADIVEDWSARQPDRPALISEPTTLSYRELAARINRYARWALSAGKQPGRNVRLFLTGGPAYVPAGRGGATIGGGAAP